MNKVIDIICKREILGKEFNIYGTYEEPKLLAKDVAEWIDYSFKDKVKGTRNVNMMLEMVDEDEKLVARLLSSGQQREMWFLTEDGVYEVLMQSRKSIAKQFKKEIKRILREIRMNGFYITTNKDEQWLGVRTESKIARRSFTDEIKDFVEYALKQGSHKPNMYYIHFTKLVNEKLGIPKNTKREDLSQSTLMDIMALERVMSMKLPKLVTKDMPYKDIYKEIKNLIATI